MKQLVPTIAAAAVAGALMSAAIPAHAVLQLATQVGSTGVCVVDQNFTSGGPCSGFAGTVQADFDAAPGAIGIAPGTNIGGLIVTGSTSNVFTAGSLGILSSGSISVLNPTASLINALFAVSATDYTGPVNVASTSGSGTFVNLNGVTDGSDITLAWYDDPANAQGANSPTDAPGDLIDAFAFAASGNPVSFSHDGGPFSVNDLGAYSMTQTFNLNLTPGSSLLSRGQAEVKQYVPEPASALLFGLGAVALSLVRRRTK